MDKEVYSNSMTFLKNNHFLNSKSIFAFVCTSISICLSVYTTGILCKDTYDYQACMVGLSERERE